MAHGYRYQNLFFIGPYQAAASAKQPYVLDRLTIHVAFVLAKAKRDGIEESLSTGMIPCGFLIEPNRSFEEKWTELTLRRASGLGDSHHCTPGHLNMDGMASEMTKKAMNKNRKSSVWGTGPKGFFARLEKSRAFEIDYAFRNVPY
ncbi:hypothetical protein N7520_002832 [Penicillium odoratum]|uniref:uncharacterized protein n=1 Tax=Penicillium odoratum TaxID=1167516 RepID=UPI0025486542|nr:uncharacterized protein N7520_002832 [Penicillium odoratum]KAJ5772303.1 hypothetical protein N7520_002832 [Penicillium odoratum]